MTMNYTTLTNYGKSLLDVIRSAETISALPENVSDGTITLGYGYTFIRKGKSAWEVVGTLADDLAKIGVILSTEDMQRLEAIRKSLSDGFKGTPAHDQLIADFTSRWCYAALSTTDAQILFDAEMVHQVEALRKVFKAVRPADGVAILDGLANTKELVAITSLFYNGPKLVGKGLINALADGNRAEAWFQIRYGWDDNDPSNNNGWAKRHYMESTVFGLYEKTPSDPVAEAKDIYRMFTLHRDEMLKRENTYGGMVANANGDYALALASTGCGQVQTLVKSLDPACTLILDGKDGQGGLANSTDPSVKTAYQRWSVDNRASFISTNLYYGAGAGSEIDARPYESIILNNDILIAEDGIVIKDYTLRSGQGNDLLIGGKGADKLYGGEGTDFLAGGEGNDKYYVTTGETVTIEDKDGINTIYLDDRVLATFYRLGDGTYISYDGSQTGELTNGEFIIQDSNGTKITLNADFQEGDFGITFKDKPQDPVTPSTITGDIIPIDIDTSKAGIQAAVDANGNPLGQAAPYEDILQGSAGNDHIMAGELLDLVGAWTGDDWVEGGTGSDYLMGGEGDDLIEGGSSTNPDQAPSRDVLVGDAGNDRLYAENKIDTDTAIEQGNTDTGSGQQGEWMAGGAGDDTLVSGADNDVLSGGDGADLLIAGAGDDIILGDADYVTPYNMPGGTWRYQANGIDWYSVSPDTFNWGYTFNGDTLEFTTPMVDRTDPAAVGGNDIIYAGAGDDHAWAGGGDDIVYGEDGNDRLDGQDGNDMLFGGKGDDTLFGDGQTTNSGNDYLDGEDGNDTLWGGAGDDELMGGAGADKLYGEAGSNYLDGEDGNDLLNTGGTANTLFGGAGNDTLQAAGGNNYLDGEDGTDTLVATGGGNTLFGGAGNDNLQAAGGNNYLDGEAGNNYLFADGGNNTLFAGAGEDTLAAQGGNNYLDGGDGTNLIVTNGLGGNTLIAGSGNDTLSAEGGNNYLDGGDGSNTLIATGGGNTLISGSGNDILQATGGNNYPGRRRRQRHPDCGSCRRQHPHRRGGQRHPHGRGRQQHPDRRRGRRHLHHPARRWLEHHRQHRPRGRQRHPAIRGGHRRYRHHRQTKRQRPHPQNQRQHRPGHPCQLLRGGRLQDR